MPVSKHDTKTFSLREARMRERVNTIIGKKPIILVAPHGADDTNTAIIAETAAKQIDAYAVINQGFDRADYVDAENDIADCNRINHCKDEVVYEEFLKPIIKFKDKILSKSLQSNRLNQTWHGKYPQADPLTIFYIHGCGDAVHKEASEPVGVIVGYGLGTKKDSITCDLWRKNLFIDLWRKNPQSSSQLYGDAFEGRGNARYAGRNSNNLNQYFRKHDCHILVNSLQLELPYSCRKTTEEAEATGKHLANLLHRYLMFNNYESVPFQKFI